MVGFEMVQKEEEENQDEDEDESEEEKEEISFADSVTKIFATKESRSTATGIADEAREKMMEKLEKLKQELEQLQKSEASASAALETAQNKLHTAVGPRESIEWPRMHADT